MDTNHLSNETVASYDEVPYTSVAFPEVHPNRLAVIATLFEMSPSPITNCRVLELGCGSASSLIAIATNLPDSQFLGIDLSLNEVKKAQEKIKALGLKNIDIKHLNIMDVDEKLGRFDYIFAPGVYSWVPPAVRDKVFSICQALLSPNGVAYINYNTYPGWHEYQALRDILFYHTKNTNNIHDTLKEAREFTHSLADSITNKDNSFGLFLKEAVEEIDTWDDGQLRHDLLGDISQPFYFHEFMEAASKHQLQYLGEAPFQTMITSNFSETEQHFINKAGSDIIKSEQYMDFIRNRQFRETLLCHANIKLNRTISLDKLRPLFFVSQINPVSPIPNILSDQEEEFRAYDDTALASNHPIVKALWAYLSIESPKPASFDDIVKNVRDELGSGNFIIQEFEEKADAQTILLSHLLQGFCKGYLQPLTIPTAIFLQVSSHPKTTPLIRYDAKHQLQVTNQLHQIVRIDHFAHHILPHLDGEHSLDDLLAILINDVKTGGIKLDKNGAPITDELLIKKILQDQLVNVLQRAAKTGLLIG